MTAMTAAGSTPRRKPDSIRQAYFEALDRIEATEKSLREALALLGGLRAAAAYYVRMASGPDHAHGGGDTLRQAMTDTRAFLAAHADSEREGTR